MKTTGITRRIDELGRIVLPKEIRKNMHIKTGDLLEIYLIDSDTISLKKHSILNSNQDFLYSFIKTIGKSINSDIYITSLDKIVFSTIIDFVDKTISSELEEQIRSGSIFKNVGKLILTKQYTIDDNFKVFPISPNGDIAGIIIYKFNDIFNSYSENLIKFCNDFLTNYLESY